MKTKWQYQPTPNWRIGMAVDVHKLRYRDETYARGHNGIMRSWQVNASWQHADTLLYGGISIHKLSPDEKMLGRRDNYYAYNRYGFYAGVLKQWNWHKVITNAHFSWGQRRFAWQWMNENFELRKRVDFERSYGVSVWRPELTIFKMTPKLCWSYQSIDSSHLWAKRRSNQLTISLER